MVDYENAIEDKSFEFAVRIIRLYQYLVNEKKEYLGGAIAPGIGISLNALVEKTAQLPKVEMTVPDKVIGKTTVSAIQSGLLYGYCGLVDGMVHRIAAELGYAEQDITVVATGGLAEVIHAHSETIHQVDQMLTLKGLLTIYKRNEKLHRANRSASDAVSREKDGAVC